MPLTDPSTAGNPRSTTPSRNRDSSSIFEGLRQRPTWRLVTLVLGGTALGLSLYYIARKLLSSLQQLGEMDLAIRWWPVALSFTITLLCVFLATMAWYLILKGFGASTPWAACAPGYLVAAMGRYVPGYVWRHLGMAYLTKRQGIGMKRASGAVLWEFGQVLATRMVIAVTAVPRPLLSSFMGKDVLTHLDWIRVAAWSALLASPLLANRLLRWPGSSDSEQRPVDAIEKKYLWLAMALHVVGNLTYGVGFAILLTALQPIDAHQFVAAIFSTSISWVLSLLVFFVPGGLGVRESVIIYTLGNVLPESIAVMGALTSRAILILAELSGALIGVWMWRRHPLCK